MPAARPEADTPEVVAPPPLIYAGFLLLGGGLEALWPTALIDPSARYVVGLSLLLVGVAAGVATLLQFRRANTTVSPYRTATRILDAGLFGLSRNPIYAAMALTSVGIAFLCDSVWMLVAVVPAVLTIDIGVIRREERHLERRFGDEYLAYKARVRRWI